MRFAILGALEAYDDEGRRLRIGGPQQHSLLAVLVLDANNVVSADRLVECLWGDRPPGTARALLQGCVSDLRRRLCAGRELLITQHPGYRLRVLPDELDADRFERLVVAASEPGVSPGKGAALLEQALALWRGPVLGGAAPDAVQAEVAGLAERRLVVLEQRIDLDLSLGRSANLVAELESLVRSNPLRERFWVQLMLALHGSGRRVEALAAYQRVRRVLVDQLGVEPGAALRAVHDAVQKGDDPWKAHRTGREPRTDREPRPVVPAQLPPAVAAFTGRAEHLKWLDELLPAGGGTASFGVVSGTAGVGKTALAVHWAHQVRASFQDGQLYVNLRGHARTPPLPPVEALAGFLQALGTPADQIPVEEDQAAALYRTLLADKRVLVVLDNARSAEQIRPLLPGSPGSLVLVTSRHQLGGAVAQDGARPLTLDVLDRDEAVTLLTKVLGAQRVAAEPEVSAELVDRCDRLPLALRIAAANLALRPRRRIADQLADLSTEDRLGALEVPGDEQSAVRAAFGLSYGVLPEPARLLFRRLGLPPGPDVTVPAAAALAGYETGTAAQLLDSLVGAHLVHSDTDGRFALHDLLRLYAGERADQEDDAADRATATARLFDWYLRTADAAARQLYPSALRLPVPTNDTEVPVAGFADPASALGWFDAELANLVATIQYTAEHGPHPFAWLLADILRGYFMLRVLPVEWAVTVRAGRSAAEAAGESRAQVAIELSAAGAHLRQNRYPRAIEHFHRALTINRRVGWPEAESSALGNLGTVYLSSGRLRLAADHFARGLVIDRRVGWLAGQAAKLGNLGVVSRYLGRLAQAEVQLREVLSLFDKLGSRYGEAIALGNLGAVLHLLGRFPEAVSLLTRAVETHRELGDRGTEANDMIALASVHLDAGRLAEARDLAESALALATEIGEHNYVADACTVLGSVHLRLDERGPAEEEYRRALDVTRRTEFRRTEVAALIGLAEVRRARGDTQRARNHAEVARTLARSIEHRVLEGRALLALAAAALDDARPAEAADLAAQAVHIQRATGYRLGLANALVTLGSALSAADPGTTTSFLDEAGIIRQEIGATAKA
jgi:DNA-binding SARP family transcriptional activator/Tfp pilus assembly protein PilF